MKRAIAAAMLTEHWPTLWLTTKLAAITTLLLVALCLPLAWWLARSRHPLKPLIQAVTTLPLVLPPTVLGFYLLLAMGPAGPLGRLTEALGLGLLPFTFSGLVIASMIYSLPFVLQPLQHAFESVDPELLEAAELLNAGSLDRFCSIVLPLSRPGLLTACVLGFAHTVGEFGVVLMLGGNIRGETRVISIEIYNQVEAMQYSAAHELSLILLVFSTAVLLALFALRRRQTL